MLIWSHTYLDIVFPQQTGYFCSMRIYRCQKVCSCKFDHYVLIAPDIEIPVKIGIVSLFWFQVPHQAFDFP